MKRAWGLAISLVAVGCELSERPPWEVDPFISYLWDRDGSLNWVCIFFWWAVIALAIVVVVGYIDAGLQEDRVAREVAPDIERAVAERDLERRWQEMRRRKRLKRMEVELQQEEEGVPWESTGRVVRWGDEQEGEDQ